MLATVIAPNATTTTGLAAAWPVENPDASDAHFPEGNVEATAYGLPPHPTFFQFPRQPVDGLRAILGTLNRMGIPLLPKGPPMVARMGQGFNGARNIQTPPKPISRVQEYVPVTPPAATGDWYEYLA